MFCKKSLLFCHVSIFCTMVDLFCTKRLFLQETAFFPDYFTRDKNGRNSFSKEFSCSCAINKFRTATLCRILNYSAEHFKMPGNYSISSYLLRIEKKRHFLKKQANTSKEYRRKICKSFTKTPTFAVHFVRVLWVCPPRLYSTTCQYPTQKGKFLKSTETVAQRCSVKKVVLEIHKIHWKAPVPEPLFNKVAGLRPWGLQLY